MFDSLLNLESHLVANLVVMGLVLTLVIIRIGNNFVNCMIRKSAILDDDHRIDDFSTLDEPKTVFRKDYEYPPYEITDIVMCIRLEKTGSYGNHKR